MNKDNGGPAFPAPEAAKARFGEANPDAFLGMSLRDYFAAKALQGLIAGSMADGSTWGEEAETLLPVIAYKIADGLLAARSA